jgi:hypothetical protein
MEMIKATLKSDWEMLDASVSPPKKITIQAGLYVLERIDNPCGHRGTWLVLMETKIGMAEGAWKQWINGIKADEPGHPACGQPIDWGEFEIVLEENGRIVPPPLK